MADVRSHNFKVNNSVRVNQRDGYLFHHGRTATIIGLLPSRSEHPLYLTQIEGVGDRHFYENELDPVE